MQERVAAGRKAQLNRLNSASCLTQSCSTLGCDSDTNSTLSSEPIS